MEIDDQILSDLSKQSSKSAKNKIAQVLLFILLPCIPAISIFLGTHLVGINNGYIQFLTFQESLIFSVYVYFSFISTVSMMALFIFLMTHQNGDCRDYLSSINYCTYLSLPFVFFGLFSIKPDFIILLTGFISAIVYSGNIFYRSFHNFLGIGCLKDINKLNSVFSTVSFFLLIVAVHIMFFINNFAGISQKIIPFI